MDKELQQLSDLEERFAYMFASPNLGLDIYRGWLPDFIDACEQIDVVLGGDKRGFHWRQIKEKYGFARYYFRTDSVHPMRLSISDGKGVYEITKGLDGHEIEQQIAQICSNAEQASLTKCIVCGDTAAIKTYAGWAVCACEKHSPDVPGDHMKKAALK